MAALAYVFWHRPRGGSDPDAYEDALLRFHARLGRPGSLTFRLGAPPPFAPGTGWYLDWYPVAGWEDLGRLNAEAVSGAPRAAHDDAARAVGDGHGEVRLRTLGEQEALADASELHWLAKPLEVPYDGFRSGLTRASAVWERQMVLGPAPEFCVAGPTPPGAAATTPVHRIS